MKTMVCPNCWGAKCSYCNNDGFLPDIQLSNDFWLSEMVKSETAVRNHVSNAPTLVEIDHCTILVKSLLQPIRNGYGKPIVVTSGIRMPVVNKLIGGSAAHPSGYAADIHSPGNSRKSLVDYIIASKLVFDQVIFEGTWVHVSRYNPAGTLTRMEVLATFDAGKTYVKYDANDKRLS